MVKTVTVEQMRRSDVYTIEHLVPSMELIRRAAYSVFCEVDWFGNIAIAAGSGNNGADGFALACILKEHGIDSTVFTVSERLHDECAMWAERASENGVMIHPYKRGCFVGYDMIIDCMLGTGFQGSLKEAYRNAIEEINDSHAYVVSVDINSGMNGDSGAGELIVCSSLTVTVEFVKRGQLTQNAGWYIKRLVCVEIGIADSEGAECVADDLMVPWLEREARCYI